MAQLKISSILERPVSQQNWPHLQQMIKILNEFIAQRAKNRQYLEAQRAKEKIIQCQDQIKKRNRFEISQRQRHAIQQLSKAHAEENARMEKEWEVRKKKIEKEFADIIVKKVEKQELQKEKYMQQLEIALPLNSSPDKQLYQLKHQQELAVQVGDFVEAQRIKMEIMKKQIDLGKKYQRIRENNIKTMMYDLESKHAHEILGLEAKRDEKLMENDRQRSKRMKELNDKHEREIKELIWIYNEQKKKSR